MMSLLEAFYLPTWAQTNAIDLTKVAPDLLQAVSLSLPAIAIFMSLVGKRDGQSDEEIRAFKAALVSLFLVVLAAGFNVVYLALYRQEALLYAAVGFYLIGLTFLAFLTGYVLVTRK